MNQRDATRRDKPDGRIKKQSPQQPLARTLPVMGLRVAAGGRLLRGLDFDTVSFLASEKAWHTPCDSTAEKLVLCYLAHRANKEDAEAWPKIETIAQDTGLSTRTTKRQLKTLLSKGHILVRRTGRENHWKFTWPDVTELRHIRDATIEAQQKCRAAQPTNTRTEIQQTGNGSPDSLSKADIITVQKELERVQKRLANLQGDLINDRLTQERKDLRGYEAKLIAKVRNYTEQLCRS